MSAIQSLFFPITHMIALGGPVIAILTCVSILALAICLYKLWQFQTEKVSAKNKLSSLVRSIAAGEEASISDDAHILAPVIKLAARIKATPGARERIEAEAELEFARLERGMRTLDIIAQLAPLLGLFGTVLGMIEAFQAMQGAGANVDPSQLAGGIWVALLTTAAGLAVAMPTSVALSWFEARIDHERMEAEKAFARILTPDTEHSAPQHLEPTAHVA